ncbi:MAG: MerR family transcriptional regulator [Lachnospiraceae bacterium]
MSRQYSERQYSIHEVAKLLGISADAIRLYEKAGLVDPPRREENGYRYYEVEQIHRIMGISLWRQLGVGLSEIKKVFEVSDFVHMSEEFGALIENSEAEVERLQQKIEKLKFMKKHLESLNGGIGNYRVRTLPKRYVVYENKCAKVEYESVKNIISQPVFSYGNFCYTLEREEKGTLAAEHFQFIIREPMIDISPLAKEKDNMLSLDACDCIYTVTQAPELEPVSWNVEPLYRYAKENGYQLSEYVYAFYVYSLMTASGIIDYYEIYAPMRK